MCRRPTFHYFTFGFSLYAPHHYDRHHPLNLIQAILFRLCTHNPVSVYPDLTFGFKFLDLIPFEIAATSKYLDYVFSRNWSTSKKRQWLRTCGPIMDQQNWPFPNHHEAYHHDVFIKDEFYLDPTKPPRIICNAQPLVKAVHATALFSASETFFHSKYSVKHCSDKPHAIEERLGKANFYIGMDCSSWETSMNFYYQLVFALYVSRFPESEPFITSILYHTHEKGKMKLKHRLIEAEIPLCRMSGDYETSFGNSVINFLLISSYFRTDRVIVEGDDAIVAVDEVPSTLVEDFRSFGFRLTPVVSTHPGKVGFCSLYWDEFGPYREPEKFYRGLLVNTFTGLGRSELQAAKLRSADYNYPGNPIIVELCKRHPGKCRIAPLDAYHELLPGAIPKGKFQLIPHTVSEPQPYAYYARYGFCPSLKGTDVELIENALKQHNVLPNYVPELAVQLHSFPNPSVALTTVISESQLQIHIQHGQNFKKIYKAYFEKNKKDWTSKALSSYFEDAKEGVG